RRVGRRGRLGHEGRYCTLPPPPDQGAGLGKPLKLINHPVRERIPIYIAAIGPKNVELAAEIAEGWIPIFFVPEKAREVWGEALAAGKARRDPELGELEVVVQAMLAIGDDVGDMVELARPMLARYIRGMGAQGRNFYNDLARRYGYEKEAEQIQDLYLAGRKDEAAALVPRELLELTSLVGPEGLVRERIAAMREAGVTVLNVTPMANTHAERVRLIERVRELAS